MFKHQCTRKSKQTQLELSYLRRPAIHHKNIKGIAICGWEDMCFTNIQTNICKQCRHLQASESQLLSHSTRGSLYLIYSSIPKIGLGKIWIFQQQQHCSKHNLMHRTPEPNNFKSISDVLTSRKTWQEQEINCLVRKCTLPEVGNRAHTWLRSFGLSIVEKVISCIGSWGWLALLTKRKSLKTIQ